jgi:hypothetical protein
MQRRGGHHRRDRDVLRDCFHGVLIAEVTRLYNRALGLATVIIYPGCDSSQRERSTGACRPALAR